MVVTCSLKVTAMLVGLVQEDVVEVEIEDDLALVPVLVIGREVVPLGFGVWLLGQEVAVAVEYVPVADVA